MKLRGFKWVTPGSLVAIVVWIVASALFAFYVSNFSSYDKTYGTLGGLIALLVWFWISNLAILFGHQLNAERERSLELAEGRPRAEREIQLEPRDEPKQQADHLTPQGGTHGPIPTKIPAQLKPLAEELLDNSYARENLQEGAEKLRDAYDRSRKRRVKPSKDRKLRKQIEAAVAALDEGTAALASGRKKPKRTGRNVVLARDRRSPSPAPPRCWRRTRTCATRSSARPRRSATRSPAADEDGAGGGANGSPS